MEKGTGKNHNTKLCFLVSLSAFFWVVLLYFHFVRGSSTVDESVKLQLGLVNDEPILGKEHVRGKKVYVEGRQTDCVLWVFFFLKKNYFLF
jgi:hypothetical protein